MPPRPPTSPTPVACVTRTAAVLAIAAAAWVATLAVPSSVAAAVAIRDDPIFAVRLQDDSDVVVRCGSAGKVEVLVDGAVTQQLQTACSAVTYIELNAAGSGSNVLDVSAVTKEVFPALPDVNGILVEAGTGDDTLIGSPFSDLLPGGDGNDRITGGGGDDNVNGGQGADSMDCGDGVDLLTYFTDRDGVRVDLTSESPFSGGEAEGDTASGCEHLRGGAANDRLAGVPGAFDVDGGTGDDLVFGLPGNHLAGGPGVDTASFVRATSGVIADLALQSISGSSGDFTLGAFENVIGSRYDDRLIGDGAVNALTGGAGGDRIEGGAGSDRLVGGGGNDRLAGAAGADKLVGGPGNDALDGGPGRDSCSGGAGRNRLTGC
jgi:Ca2+-binding RTX toxin-like protein